jgi:hypothetical protein
MVYEADWLEPLLGAPYLDFTASLCDKVFQQSSVNTFWPFQASNTLRPCLLIIPAETMGVFTRILTGFPMERTSLVSVEVETIPRTTRYKVKRGSKIAIANFLLTTCKSITAIGQ